MGTGRLRGLRSAARRLPRLAKNAPASQRRRLGSFLPFFRSCSSALCVSRNETSSAVWLCVFLIDSRRRCGRVRTSSFAPGDRAGLAPSLPPRLWIVTGAADIDDLLAFLGVAAGSGIFFFSAATSWRALQSSPTTFGGTFPRSAALMPFLLLLMVIAKLPMPNPTPFFVAAFFLASFCLGSAFVSRTSWIARDRARRHLGGRTQWQTLHFSRAQSDDPARLVSSFLRCSSSAIHFSRRRTKPFRGPSRALSGALHFWLIYEIISRRLSAMRNGLLPAAFILPYAVGAFHLIKKRGVVPHPEMRGSPGRLVPRCFSSVSFSRSSSIANGSRSAGRSKVSHCSGLFRVVPHRGLRYVGVGIALCRVRSPRLESRGPRVSSAQRDADLELVSLRLRHCRSFARSLARGSFARRAKTPSNGPRRQLSTR